MLRLSRGFSLAPPRKLDSSSSPTTPFLFILTPPRLSNKLWQAPSTDPVPSSRCYRQSVDSPGSPWTPLPVQAPERVRTSTGPSSTLSHVRLDPRLQTTGLDWVCRWSSSSMETCLRLSFTPWPTCLPGCDFLPRHVAASQPCAGSLTSASLDCALIPEVFFLCCHLQLRELRCGSLDRQDSTGYDTFSASFLRPDSLVIRLSLHYSADTTNHHI